MPDLGRPTKSSDTLPLFNFEGYFLGKWTFEWDVPDSALGPAGTITGTTTYHQNRRHLLSRHDRGDRYRQPDHDQGNVSGCKKDNKAIARQVTDSRSSAFTQVGTVDGDLGGYYNVYLDSAPTTVGGKSIRLRHTLRLLSPVNFKVERCGSPRSGGPFTNFGTPWWRKEAGTR